MNNREYLQFEGASLAEEALLAFTSPPRAATCIPSFAFPTVYCLKVRSCWIPFSGTTCCSACFWRSEIRTFKSGFGCLDALVEGMEESLSHFPDVLRALSVRRELNGSFLLAGSRVHYPDRDSVDRRSISSGPSTGMEIPYFSSRPSPKPGISICLRSRFPFSWKKPCITSLSSIKSSAVSRPGKLRGMPIP